VTAPYPPLVVTRKSGAEAFHAAGAPIGANLLTFWQWSASDLASNALRGRVAEFLIGHALGITHGTGVRAEWDAYDLVTPDGLTLEVKSSAYLQTWGQQALSLISFGIGPTRYWDPATNAMAPTACRQAMAYVFALVAHRDKPTLDVLDVTQWRFFVLPTAVLNDRLPTQKQLSLGGLLALQPAEATYATLADTIAQLPRATPSQPRPLAP
jgi:hypothetical protein